MSVLPESRLGLVEFCEYHIATWNANAAAIGLTTAAVSALDLDTKATRGKHTGQQLAKLAAKSATDNFYAGEEGLRDRVAAMVRTIKTFAENSANPEAVYSLAQIPAPTPPTPKPAPSQPTAIKVTLASSGAVSFTWKNTNGGTGASYVVRRRPYGAEGAWTIAGTSLRRSFTDESLPGSGPWEYYIQGYRTELAGPESDHFVVRLGASGLQVTTLSPTSPNLKMSA